MKKLVALAAFATAVVLGFISMPQLFVWSYTPVEAFRTVSTTSVSTVQASGTLSAGSKRDICFGCPIKISKYDVSVGQRVAAGQQLFDVDTAVTLQALQNKESQNDEQKSSSSGSASSTVSQAQEKLQQALSSGVIGQGTYDALLQKLGQAAAASSSAAEGAGGNAGEDATAVATLDYLEQHLTAPVSGVVTAINDSGTFISTGETVVEISDLDTIILDTRIPEAQIESVKLGQPALITGDGFSGTLTGHVSAIAPTADSTSGSGEADRQNTVDVTIELDHHTGSIKPGMSANAVIRTSKGEKAVLLPYDAVKQDSDGTEYVYVFQNGHAFRRDISASDENSGGVLVRKGVQAGDVVLKNPPSFIQNGSIVRIEPSRS